MTQVQRRRPQRQRMHQGALRFLLGANPTWIYDKGDCTHGSVVRWRRLFLRINDYDRWQEYQEQFWQEMRNTVIAWHRVRGWAAPPSHLRGHKQERAWLARQRRDNPRGKYQVDLAARWGMERKFGE